MYVSDQSPEARTYIYMLAKVTAEIQQQVTEVSQCGVCHEYLQKQEKEPLMTYL